MQSCTKIEVENLIGSLPNKTSSGYDKISNILLKELQSCVSSPLSIIFNKSLSMGCFPDQMKNADVIPLYKGGNRRILTNYRPISLLLTLSKLLEKIMYKRVYEFLDINHALYDSQYGFRKKHSCEHAISKLLSNIVKGFEKREFTISIFLDLSKAFDTLLHSVMFDKLERYGICRIVFVWFKSYLSDRSMQAKCNTGGPEPVFSKDYKVSYGTPQGSCLSPLLFLIFCNDLYYNLEFCSCILFVDDTTIYKSHKNLRYLEWIVNEDLKIVANWFMCNKLTLNVKKTVCLLFSPNNKVPNSISLCIGNEPIVQCNNTKFLGVWLDDRLNWRTHLLKLLPKLKRGEKLLCQCKKFLDSATLKIYTILCAIS